WITGTDGNTTPETIYHVETPTSTGASSTPSGVLSTEYSPYPGSASSTFSTETTWFTGTDGKTTPETIYHVETPTSIPVKNTPHSWSGGNRTSITDDKTYYTTNTDVITSATTYCPYPTTLITQSQTFTVTQPSTLTITYTNSGATAILPVTQTTSSNEQNTVSPQATTTNEASQQGANTQQNNGGSPATFTSLATSTTNEASQQGADTQQSNGGSPATVTSLATSTEIVTELTTYCPSPTVLTTNGATYTITEATTLTITDCPCTLTHTNTIMKTADSNAPVVTAFTDGSSSSGNNNGGSPETFASLATSTNDEASQQGANTQQNKGDSPETVTSLATSTEIVTELTTYCPSPTVLTTNGATYTITEATTLTITDCPCTLTHTNTIMKTADSNTPAATAFTTGGSSNSGNNNSGQNSAQANVAVVTTTEVVETLTTYCSDYTILSTNGAAYTVTAPTTLTITDCPCTVTRTNTVSDTQPTEGPTVAGFNTTTPAFGAAGFGYTNKTQALAGPIFNNGSNYVTTIYGGNSSAITTTASPLSLSSSSPYTKQSVSSKGGDNVMTQYNTVTATADESPRTEPTEVSTTTLVASNITVTEGTTAFTTITPSQSALPKRDYNRNSKLSVTISSNAANSLTSSSLIAILGFLFMLFN
ncbi:hypothetical protein ZYGR_0R00100, partial [Zygosaccharomyces rouxii]